MAAVDDKLLHKRDDNARTAIHRRPVHESVQEVWPTKCQDNNLKHCDKTKCCIYLYHAKLHQYSHCRIVTENKFANVFLRPAAAAAELSFSRRRRKKN